MINNSNIKKCETCKNEFSKHCELCINNEMYQSNAKKEKDFLKDASL